MIVITRATARGALNLKHRRKCKIGMREILMVYGKQIQSDRKVERLGAALARQSGQEEEEAVRHLWGKLGMLLQRGNAAILANCVPSFPAPAIDGMH